MLLLDTTNKILDFSYIGKLSNLCFCLPNRRFFFHWQALKSMLLLAKANTSIDFFIHWQALKSMLLLTKANKIIDFSYIGKLSNLCFCLPRQTKSLSFPTLGSSQIYAFTRQGKRNCYFCLHWQALKSMLLLARAQKIIEFAYSGKLSTLCLW
jgi:hypothetical protein